MAKLIGCGYPLGQIQPTTTTTLAPVLGDLDPSFSDGLNAGFVVHSNNVPPASSDTINGIAVDSGGNVITVGISQVGNYPSEKNYAFVNKYKADGSIDTTFNNSGVITTRETGGPDWDDQFNAVVVDPSDNILVAGTSNSTNEGKIVIRRFKADGAVDPSFGGGDGLVLASAPAGYRAIAMVQAIAVDADGKIVVTGSATAAAPFGDGDLMVARFNGDGTPDIGFGGGMVFFEGAIETKGNEYGYSIAFDSSKNIYIGGQASGSSGMAMTVYKYKNNGTMDAVFGDGTHHGYVVYSGELKAGGMDYGRSIALDAAGNIWVCGFSQYYKGSNDQLPDAMALWKLNPDGTKTSVNIYTTATSEGADLAVDPSGKIIVVGYVKPGATADIGLWRFKADGALDTSFGSGGLISFDLVESSGIVSGSNADNGTAVAHDLLGKIMVGGFTGGAIKGYKSIILRYK